VADAYDVPEPPRPAPKLRALAATARADERQADALERLASAMEGQRKDITALADRIDKRLADVMDRQGKDLRLVVGALFVLLGMLIVGMTGVGASLGIPAVGTVTMTPRSAP